MVPSQKVHHRKRLVRMCLFILPSETMRCGYLAPLPLPSPVVRVLLLPYSHPRPSLPLSTAPRPPNPTYGHPLPVRPHTMRIPAVSCTQLCSWLLKRSQRCLNRKLISWSPPTYTCLTSLKYRASCEDRTHARDTQGNTPTWMSLLSSLKDRCCTRNDDSFLNLTAGAFPSLLVFSKTNTTLSE